METLARELWDFGAFDIHDNTSEPIDFEMYKRNLWKPETRKGIISFLRDIIEYDDFDDNATIAARLLRKIKEVFH